MGGTLNLLYKRKIEVNENISIVVPTIREIIEDEDAYYGMVYMITAMPIDFMVQLDDAGIDFDKINEWELFLIMFNGLKYSDTKLVFGDLDLSKFEPGVNEENGTLVLIDTENDIKIDRSVFNLIASTLRELHGLEKNTKRPANKEAKEYMIERARTKLRRNRNKKQTSQLEPLIVALVNTEQFKYNYEQTLDLSIYQFNKSVRQIIKKIDYDNRMYGVYTGSIDAKELNQDDLIWFSNK